jgi:uncharacterized membrane protein YpjA|tara:strand:- start:905 stop:1507 length:603 start_codon:yes stop_codon:yes gene_type:complete
MKGYRILLILVLIANIFGVGFGFYYYQGLLANAPIWALPFIPDSPISTLFFSLAILLILINRKSDIVTSLASVYVMKYGIWTMFVILYYPYHFLTPQLANYYWLMFILHFGMVIEPILILHTMKRKKMILLVPIVWLLLNDLIDYGLNMNPLEPYSLPNIQIVGIFSIMETIILSAVVYTLAGNSKIKRIWNKKNNHYIQ